MKKHGNLKDDSSGVDLTPLLDVVFIMLIFFIVTASFVKEHSMAVSVPPKTDGALSVVVPTVFTVSRNNEISAENRRVDIRSVRALIAQRGAASNGTAAVVINAHEAAAVKTYVAIVDAARQENIHSVPVRVFR